MHVPPNLGRDCECYVTFWKDWAPAEQALQATVEWFREDDNFTLIRHRDPADPVDQASFLSWDDLIGQR